MSVSHIIMIFKTVNWLFVMLEYNFRSIKYIYFGPHNLVKTELFFSTFVRGRRKLTHAYHK